MSNELSDEFDQVFAPLVALPFSDPPPPWSSFTTIGLAQPEAVGFSDDGAHLLVTSLEGRHVFDCSKHECVALDDSTTYPYDVRTLRLQGIGPLAGQTVRVAGLDGGGLPIGTENGWHLHRVFQNWSIDYMILEAPGTKSIMLPANQGQGGTTKLNVTVLSRAFGFSPCNRHMIFMNSGALIISSRDV